METDILLGIDIGTQGVKGALVTAQGKILAEHTIEHGCMYPRPGWAEHDMLQNWWLDPVLVIRKLLSDSGIQPERIKAICPSGLHPNFGPTDDSGNPLCGAILYCDNRAVSELEEVNTRQHLKLTSEELTPKLIWFLRNRPELAGKMRKFFDAASYLVYRLCGEYITDTISAGGWGAIYYSPGAAWRPEVCEKFNIPVEILPKVCPPTCIVGEVHAVASAATGLKAGTPVLAGTNDVTASTIGAGAVSKSEAIAYYGTAGLLPVMKEDMVNAVRFPYPKEERGLAQQDGYLFDYPAYCLTTGDSVRWFRDEFGKMEYLEELNGTGGSAYARYDQLAREIPAGSEGLFFLPYLLGQRSPQFNPHYSGHFFGIRRIHTRGHFFRAILEAWGYTIRYGLETYYPQGHPIKRLIATGGGARSPLWRQIVSDITGIEQEYVPNSEGTLADAYLAGMAIGWFENFDILQKEWIAVTERTKPRMEDQQVYDKQAFPTYVRLHSLLDSFYS